MTLIAFAPNEIRLLFQFIKAVAAFSGVAYVVAYDRVPVEKALSFGENLDGREYLKKFTCSRVFPCKFMSGTPFRALKLGTPVNKKPHVPTTK